MSNRACAHGRIPGKTDSSGLCPPVLTRLELLEKTLEAVENQTGLIHGKMAEFADGSIPIAFCALGAFANENKNNCVHGDDAAAIHEQNDKYPNATPGQRRAYMISWLKKQINVEKLKDSLRWPINNIGEKA